MKETDEFQNEIIKLICLAKSHNPQIGNYLRHYATSEPRDGYFVELSNNKSLFINRFVLQDFSKMPSSIAEEDILSIARSLKDL